MTEKKRDDGKVPSKKPSFSSFEDDPLATFGTGASDEPKGLVNLAEARFPLTATTRKSATRRRPRRSPTPGQVIWSILTEGLRRNQIRLQVDVLKVPRPRRAN